MPIHFTEQELAARREATAEKMIARGLDGLLMFHQASMYYLTGYDSGGFAFFQCLYLGADGALTLLTRVPDLRQAQYTSVIEDIRIWVDRAGKNPADDLHDVLASHGCAGKTLGIEWDSYGLTALNGRNVAAALDGLCQLEDASELVSELRVVKSPAELTYVRRAAELADAAYEEAVRLAKPGAFEGDILAAMEAAMFRGDGDFGGMDTIIGSDRGALLLRHFAGRRHLSERDQLTLEFCGVYRRYHSGLMRTLLIGKPAPTHFEMYQACRDALRACMHALKPGRPVGEVFDAYANNMDNAGFKEHRFNACGYSVGASYSPSWVDPPWFNKDNPFLPEPNMVFFPQVMLVNSDSGRAMTLGQTVLVTEDGCEALNKASLDLVVN